MFSLNYFEPKDFQSDIAKFNLLKTLNNYTKVSYFSPFFYHFSIQLIHINEFELVYWHIINLKMLQDGLWSKYQFKLNAVKNGGSCRKDHMELSDLLLITALMAKKLCNTEEEYEIFEEFVFHNLREAQQQNQI